MEQVRFRGKIHIIRKSAERVDGGMDEDAGEQAAAAVKDRDQQKTDRDGKNDLELYATQQTSTPADGLTVLKIGSDIVLSEAADNRGYVVAWNALKYTWNEERDYLWPIPADQRVLTGGLLTQNPGWTDSTNFD